MLQQPAHSGVHTHEAGDYTASALSATLRPHWPVRPPTGPCSAKALNLQLPLYLSACGLGVIGARRALLGDRETIKALMENGDPVLARMVDKEARR